MRSIITWFLRQRAYRAKTYSMDYQKYKREKIDGNDSSNCEEEEYDQQHMQQDIDNLIADHKARKEIEAKKEKEQKEIEAMELLEKQQLEIQAIQDVEKFDKSKHAGTVYDPVSGRRVPVAKES